MRLAWKLIERGNWDIVRSGSFPVHLDHRSYGMSDLDLDDVLADPFQCGDSESHNEDFQEELSQAIWNGAYEGRIEVFENCGFTSQAPDTYRFLRGTWPPRTARTNSGWRTGRR